jgi:hypothetical protein
MHLLDAQRVTSKCQPPATSIAGRQPATEKSPNEIYSVCIAHQTTAAATRDRPTPLRPCAPPDLPAAV